MGSKPDVKKRFDAVASCDWPAEEPQGFLLKQLLSMSTSSSEDMWVVAGFTQDCMQLFHQFAETGSLRYKDFGAVYKSLNFNHVFYGRLTLKEQMEFVDEALNIAKEFAYKEEDVYKVGSIYLMYSLYFCQPVKYFGKICVTNFDAGVFSELIEEFAEQGLWDPSFILSKMMKAHAFQFTTTRTEMLPEMLKRQKFKIDQSPLDDIIHIPSIKKFTESDTDFKNFERLCSKYNSLKRKWQDLAPADEFSFNSSGTENLCEDIKFVVSGESAKSTEVLFTPNAAAIGRRRQHLKTKAMKGDGPHKMKQKVQEDGSTKVAFTPRYPQLSHERMKVRKRATTDGTFDAPLEEAYTMDLPDLPHTFLASMGKQSLLDDMDNDDAVEALWTNKKRLVSPKKRGRPKSRDRVEKKVVGRPKGSKNKVKKEGQVKKKRKPKNKTPSLDFTDLEQSVLEF